MSTRAEYDSFIKWVTPHDPVNPINRSCRVDRQGTNIDTIIDMFINPFINPLIAQPSTRIYKSSSIELKLKTLGNVYNKHNKV